jgi:4'-phosphopantetheinyl transferase
MNTHFSIKNSDVHLWRIYLPQFIDESTQFLSILSPEEIKRAKRFHFEKHRERFIITHYFLRHILSLYIGLAPSEITFYFGDHGKPYLKHDQKDIYFNLSHSDNIAILGLICHKEIGVDIEKIETKSKMNVAKRFFNEDEYAYLLGLPKNKQNIEFYKLWACKEAVIKALGRGLSIPLNSFSILNKKSHDPIILNDNNQTYRLIIQNIAVHEEYQAAIALPPPISELYFWEWTNKGPIKL